MFEAFDPEYTIRKVVLPWTVAAFLAFVVAIFAGSMPWKNSEDPGVDPGLSETTVGFQQETDPVDG